jgi:hypothetical protein
MAFLRAGMEWILATEEGFSSKVKVNKNFLPSFRMKPQS